MTCFSTSHAQARNLPLTQSHFTPLKQSDYPAFRSNFYNLYDASLAVQQAAFSTFIQNGEHAGGPKIIAAAVEAAELTTNRGSIEFAEQVIRNIYAARARKQPGDSARYGRELEAALKTLRKNKDSAGSDGQL